MVLEILGQPAAATERGEGPLHYPSSRQDVDPLACQVNSVRNRSFKDVFSSMFSEILTVLVLDEFSPSGHRGRSSLRMSCRVSSLSNWRDKAGAQSKISVAETNGRFPVI